MDGVWEGDARPRRAQAPATVRGFDCALVDQRAQELLDKEGIPFRPADQLPEIVGKRSIDQRVGHPRRVRWRERLQPEKGGIVPTRAPPPAAVEKLRSRRSDQQEWATDLPQEELEQVEQGLFRPVKVFDQDCRRPSCRKVTDEADRRVVQPVSRRQRVEVARDAEAESEGQNPVRKPLPYRLRRISLEDPEMLLEHLAERPVRDRVSVREAAARTAKRLRILRTDPSPELTHEPGLTDSRVADERDEMWLALLDDPLVRRLQERQLALASDEGCRMPPDASRAHQR